jgi:hypothetical protein
MKWLHAIRNVQHRLRYAGLGRHKDPLTGPANWNSRVADMAAEPHA